MDAEQALRDRFGLAEFRPWQREAMEALLHGTRRVVVIAPTGGGKSLCYQLPAVVLGGTSIVISPLISLMEDQVRALHARGIEATFLASTVDPRELEERECDLARGRFTLVYIAPERLGSGSVLDRLARLSPPLVAIDEAHCISQWGHDFRPAYLQLGRVLELLRPPRVLACTATATPRVRDEIMEGLGLPREQTTLVMRGFARPNLHLSVLEDDSAKGRRTVVLRTLKEFLGAPQHARGGSIVYAATRRNTEVISELIVRDGWRAAAYHAGRAADARERVSRDFADGNLDVVVATNAFGMGIDRPDVRAVIHVQAPGSVEAYYQEVGRAGRDGQPAQGLLLSSSSDFGLRRRLIERGGAAEGRIIDPVHMERQWDLFLDLMRYVEAGSCRHDFILRYFGDEKETLGGCGHCDACERIDERGASCAHEDALIVRQALAGVARNRGRAGLTRVAEMLQGHSSEQLERLGLTRLSTHGILKDHKRPWILALLRRLMTARLVDLTPTEFPVPVLTRDGVRAMQGTLPVRVLLPPRHVGQRVAKVRKEPLEPPVTTHLDAHAGALFERLRLKRLELARSKGFAAYMICHDRTLIEIAARRPRSMADLAAIHGMGPARLEAYGETFLHVVRSYQQ